MFSAEIRNFSISSYFFETCQTAPRHFMKLFLWFSTNLGGKPAAATTMDIVVIALLSNASMGAQIAAREHISHDPTFGFGFSQCYIYVRPWQPGLRFCDGATMVSRYLRRFRRVVMSWERIWAQKPLQRILLQTLCVTTLHDQVWPFLTKVWTPLV